MGHYWNTVDLASQSDRTDLLQRNEHIKDNWRGGIAKIGCETATLERPGRYWSHLLFAFPKRTRLAARTVVQRHPKCEPRNFEHAANPGARRRAYRASDHRIATPQ